VLEYGVEHGHFQSNSMGRAKWRTTRAASQVDRTVVVRQDQARRLLAAVDQLNPPLTALFACLFFAASVQRRRGRSGSATCSCSTTAGARRLRARANLMPEPVFRRSEAPSLVGGR